MNVAKENLRSRLRSNAQVPTNRVIATGLSGFDANTMMFYLPISDEPDITPVLRASLGAGRTVCVPRLDTARPEMQAVIIADLERDTEPVPAMPRLRQARGGLAVIDPADLDVVFVPGVAFDRRGHRLGRGAGYYDRFLTRVGPRTRIVGVCFPHQIVDEVPTEPHDVCVHALLTPDELLPVSRNV